MKDKIGDLIRLQDCDNRIRQIISKKNEAPLKIKKLEEELKAVENKFREEYNRLELLKKSSRQIDQEIQDLENKIERSNLKLFQIKSNKEYAAALKEIEDLKNAKFVTEDKAIQLMEEIEEVERVCREKKEKEAMLRIQFEKDRVEVEKELTALDGELEILEKKRDAFSQTIDKDLLREYLHLKERKEGQAISPVVAGVCQVCHINIPPQVFNELIKGNELLTCTNCSRIIYWAEDEQFQSALNKG